MLEEKIRGLVEQVPGRKSFFRQVSPAHQRLDLGLGLTGSDGTGRQAIQERGDGIHQFMAKLPEGGAVHVQGRLTRLGHVVFLCSEKTAVTIMLPNAGERQPRIA